MPIHHSILRIVYEQAVKEYREHLEELTSEDVIYVTDLVACSHKRVMRLNYPMLSFSFEPPLVLGSLIHKGLQSLLASAGWKAEVPLEKKVKVMGREYRVLGRADLVKYDEEGRAIAVAEIKTAKSLPETLPMEHHALQLQIYMELLGAEAGVIVYITPERLVEVEVERRRIDLKRLVLETISDSVHPRYQWECKYCVFRRLCPYAVKGAKS